jgi:hypothetical protein
VSTIGERRAGGNLDARPARDALARDLAREHAFDAAERLRLERAGAERVLGNHGVAVHGRAIEGRDVERRYRGLRDDATVRRADVDPLGALDRNRCVEDERKRLVKRNRLADGADSCHRLEAIS